MNAEPFLVTVRRYIQFCLVGGTGVAVDMFLIFLLASPTGLGWDLSISKVIAAETALINNFIWNDLWTFRGLAGTMKDTKGLEVHGSGFTVPNLAIRHRLARFFKFNLICTAGIGLSVLLLNFQVFVLHLNLYLANFLAIVLVSLWNFFLSLRFGWTTRVAPTTR